MSLVDSAVNAIVQAYLDDESMMNKFCKAPAAQSFHHAFLGGLLEHTLNAMVCAIGKLEPSARCAVTR